VRPASGVAVATEGIRDQAERLLEGPVSHAKLLDAGVRILEYPTMLLAKAFVRDGEELLVGTCNLEAWSLKRFFEIDVQVRSAAVAAQFDERFSVPAETVSSCGRRPSSGRDRAKAALLAALSPLL
jgi:phosphatidylserine/phosphatidylglycerophosphate/cardiolipin synthase-like enzyme